MLLSQALKLFHASRQGATSPTTCGWYHSRLDPLPAFLGDVEVETISTHDLRRWRNSLMQQNVRWSNHPHRPTKRGKLAKSTLHAYIRACKTLFRWLMDEEILEKDPARRLKQVPQPKGKPKEDISPANALRIIDAARNNPRDHALLRFLADTGCRRGGIETLTLRYLHLEADQRGRYKAVVREKGKGGQWKYRRVYFGPKTAQALKAYLEIRPDTDSEHVFLTQQPGQPVRPLRGEGVYRMIQRYAKQLKITGKWNPHAWRHAFAHGLLDHGADISEVSQLMGHSTSSITIDFYGQRTEQKLADVHAEHSWLNNQGQ